jgi:hypothetical protein
MEGEGRISRDTAKTMRSNLTLLEMRVKRDVY